MCTFKDCPTPNGHLIKACKNKNKGPKKGGKGKKREEKAKKVEEDEKAEEDNSPRGEESGEEERSNTPAPSTSKRIIVRSRLIKKSTKENISKEMKDNLRKNKRGKKK